MLVSFSHLDRHKRDAIGNPREEEPGLSEMSVCLPGTFSPDITSSGRCSVTGQGYSTSTLPAILFGTVSPTRALHRCSYYRHSEKTIVNESALEKINNASKGGQKQE